MEMKAVNSKKA